jgi:hypothetical protein
MREWGWLATGWAVGGSGGSQVLGPGGALRSPFPQHAVAVRPCGWAGAVGGLVIRLALLFREVGFHVSRVGARLRALACARGLVNRHITAGPSFRVFERGSVRSVAFCVKLSA